MPSVFTGFEQFASDILNDAQLFKTTNAVLPYNIVETVDEDSSVTQTELIVAAAGYTKQDVKITIDKDVLTIEFGKMKSIDNECTKILYRGITSRSGSLQFRLNNVDTDSVVSTFENGLLKIVLPYSNKTLKQIQIN